MKMQPSLRLFITPRKQQFSSILFPEFSMKARTHEEDIRQRNSEFSNSSSHTLDVACKHLCLSNNANRALFCTLSKAAASGMSHQFLMLTWSSFPFDLPGGESFRSMSLLLVIHLPGTGGHFFEFIRHSKVFSSTHDCLGKFGFLFVVIIGSRCFR